MAELLVVDLELSVASNSRQSDLLRNK